MRKKKQKVPRGSKNGNKSSRRFRGNAFRRAMPHAYGSEWLDFLTRLNAACKELQGCATHFFDPWFRGHTRSSHTLLPSLLRGFSKPNKAEQWDFIREQEQDLFWDFAARARELHGVIEDDWDILFAMRHYGVPTRVLDWTENRTVSMYFAMFGFSGQPGVPIEGDAGDPPCIWVLNPYELNWQSDDARDLYEPKFLGWDEEERDYYSYSELLVEPGGVDWDLPVAVYPRQRTNRMQAQQGWFTIHGDKFISLEEHPDEKSFLRKVELPIAAVNDGRQYLEDVGVGLFTLFPELPSLALHLDRRRRREIEESGFGEKRNS